MPDAHPELSRVLRQAADDSDAAAAVLPRVYDELRRLARAQMVREPAGHTLQPTALVNEAWMKLVGSEGEALSWQSRAHFFGAAARAMRQILVDRARRVRRERHGGDLRRQPLEGAELPAEADPERVDFEALDAALDALAARDERAARLVELRFFAGLEVGDAARALGISERTAAREWNVARAWLAREMGDGG